MTTKNLTFNTFPQKNFNKNPVSNLQKSAEISTAILMIASFIIWFFVLSG